MHPSAWGHLGRGRGGRAHAAVRVSSAARQASADNPRIDTNHSLDVAPRSARNSRARWFRGHEAAAAASARRRLRARGTPRSRCHPEPWQAADESACKPGPVRTSPFRSPRRRPSLSGWRCRQPLAVHPQARAGSPRTPAQAALPGHPFDLAPGGVYRAARVTPGAGALLPHPFTLARPTFPRAGRSAFCGTFPRVTPGGCYPPPCPVEPGLSSAGHRPFRHRRPTRPPGRLVRRTAIVGRQSSLGPVPVSTLREAMS